MQISVKLRCNQSCKSHRFSIWASSFLCACLENGMRGRWVRFREHTPGRKRQYEKCLTRKRIWKTLKKALIPYSKLNSFFLLDSLLKNSYRDQQCETCSAEAFRLLFDEEKGKDGGKESDETEGGTSRFVWALFTTEQPRCNIQEEIIDWESFHVTETFWP